MGDRGPAPPELMAVMDALRWLHHHGLKNGGPIYCRVFRGGRTFSLAGEDHPYCFARYNFSWSNERTVEIPVALRLLRAHEGKRVLEVGNVLGHYTRVSHEVVDKYERAPGVLNVDVVDFKSDTPYDLVLSVSTLEHVGWDETPREPEKIHRALDRLVDLVAPGGTLLVTLPLGHNPNADALALREGGPFTERRFLKRVSPDNRWVETPREEVGSPVYNAPHPGGNVVFVGLLRKG